jgi:hypothetical protein
MKKYSPFCTLYSLPITRLPGLTNRRRDQADDTSAVEAYVKGRVQPASDIAEDTLHVSGETFTEGAPGRRGGGKQRSHDEQSARRLLLGIQKPSYRVDRG